jgi:hypothetical protein
LALPSANSDLHKGSAHKRHGAKDARAHSLRVALVTIERVCARAKELRIDRRSALVRASEVR